MQIRKLLTRALGRETSVGLDATAQNGQRWLTQRVSYVQDTGVSDRGRRTARRRPASAAGDGLE